MKQHLLRAWLGFLFLFGGCLCAEEGLEEVHVPDSTVSSESEPLEVGQQKVVVVPITDAIGNANFYVLRRAVKDAIRDEADVLVLDINTPGGRVDKMLEMVDAILEFPGTTIAYVNDEAMSAGAFISMSTKEIWFAPHSVIGAAEVVSSNGEDVNESMKRKIESYLNGKIRAIVEGYRYRADIMRAMSDPDFELKLDDQVLCEKGKLLTLTYTEAMKPYGEPPEPLLGSGIAADLEDLLNQKYGEGNYVYIEHKITWSEELAKYMEKIAPILLGLGILGLFIEFKTPGFGIFGIGGILLILIVFASNYVAGLAGYEAVIFLILGMLLILLELFLAPGVIVLAAAGLLMMFGAILWSLADIWPRPENVDGFSMPDLSVFIGPLYQIFFSMALAVVLFVLLLRFLPKSWFWDKLVLNTAVAAPDRVVAGGASSVTGVPEQLPAVGSKGVAITDLHPGGTVEIEGTYYEAQVNLFDIRTGEAVVVTGYKNFYLLVEKL